jgi:hypothetical protein
MKVICFESQNDVIDFAYRVKGLTLAIGILLDPLSDHDENPDTRFAVRMIGEILGEYSDALLEAAEMPSPRLVFSKPHDAAEIANGG